MLGTLFFLLLWKLKGEWVWIAPLPSDDPSMDVPFGAKVLRTDRERTCVSMNDGKEVWVLNKQVLKTMHISSRDGVNNMIMLGGKDIFKFKRFS